jgi:Rrf2 family protein
VIYGGDEYMKISTRGRYALRIMIDLTMNNDGSYISLKDIAARQQISNKYLEQIIAKLNKAGYLIAARGNNGGYKLAKSPEEYKVGDILRVTEGKLTPIGCMSGTTCEKKENCKTFSFWQGLDKVVNDYVDSKTLKDLVK